MLMPVIDAMIGELQKSDHLFCDETTIPVLAPRHQEDPQGYTSGP